MSILYPTPTRPLRNLAEIARGAHIEEELGREEQPVGLGLARDTVELCVGVGAAR